MFTKQNGALYGIYRIIRNTYRPLNTVLRCWLDSIHCTNADGWKKVSKKSCNVKIHGDNIKMSIIGGFCQRKTHMYLKEQKEYVGLRTRSLYDSSFVYDENYQPPILVMRLSHGNH